jgi:hypothetical protein
MRTPDEWRMPDLEALYAERPRVPCSWCGANAAEGSVCPWSLSCPTCRARPGIRCKRPSGHDAAAMHADRWKAAEAIDVINLGGGRGDRRDQPRRRSIMRSRA